MDKHRVVIQFPRGERFVKFFFLTTLFVAVSIGAALCLPYAIVTLRVVGEPVITTIPITISPTITAPSPALGKLPGRAVPLDRAEIVNNGWSYDRRSIVTLRNQRYAVLYRSADLREAVASELATLLKGKRMLSDASTRLTIQTVTPMPGQTDVQYLLRAEGISVPIFPYSEWRRTSGLSPDGFAKRLRATAGVEGVSMSLWPQFWPLLPLIPSRLKFTLDIT